MNKKTERLFERLKEKNCSSTDDPMEVKESVKTALEGRNALSYFNLCNKNQIEVVDSTLYDEGRAESMYLDSEIESLQELENALPSSEIRDIVEKRESQYKEFVKDAKVWGVSDQICFEYLEDAKEIEKQNHEKYDSLIYQLNKEALCELSKEHCLEDILNTPRNIRNKSSKKEILIDCFGEKAIENLSEKCKENYEKFVCDDSDILYKHLLRNAGKIGKYLEI